MREAFNRFGGRFGNVHQPTVAANFKMLSGTLVNKRPFYDGDAGDFGGQGHGTRNFSACANGRVNNHLGRAIDDPTIVCS